MKRGSATTTATIQNKDVAVDKDSEGTIYSTYHIILEFNPMLAKSPTGPITMKAVVHKKIWDTLTMGRSIIVRYAKEDPYVVLLPGE